MMTVTQASFLKKMKPYTPTVSSLYMKWSVKVPGESNAEISTHSYTDLLH